MNVFASLAKRVVPSVVNISTISNVRLTGAREYRTPEDLFRGMLGQDFDGPGSGLNSRNNEMRPRSVSLGTGFVIDSSGIILTNNHVVQDADEIKIQFTEDSDEKPTEGKVIGRDPELDVALIQVKTDRKLVALPLGDSNALEVGEYVMAVGNPFGQGHSVSHGIVSAKGRTAPGTPFANWLQTDAPINPGNSGGPLLNLRGEVVGINNAIDARAQGISFAIPISLVKAELPQIEKNGKFSRGYIGALIAPLSPEIAERMGLDKDLRAPFVTQVTPGGPAEKAGVKPYDAIVEFASKPVHTPNELVNAVAAIEAGKKVDLKVSRSGKIQTLQIRVGEREDSEIRS